MNEKLIEKLKQIYDIDKNDGKIRNIVCQNVDVEDYSRIMEYISTNRKV